MPRVKVVGLVFVIAALLAVPMIVSAQTPQSPVTVQLKELNNSGETGTARLTDLGNNQTRVEVTVTGQPAGTPQPMHIHEGTCTNLNEQPAFPLNNLVNGSSVTTVTVGLSTLMSQAYAINGHKSAQELQTYVFCGEVSTVAGAAAAAQATATRATTATTTTAATSTPRATATTAMTTAAGVGTATPVAGQPSTLPTTGGSSSFAPLMLALGLLVLGAGILVRRFAA